VEVKPGREDGLRQKRVVRKHPQLCLGRRAVRELAEPHQNLGVLIVHHILLHIQSFCPCRLLGELVDGFPRKKTDGVDDEGAVVVF
jgi:hypothetical protein